MNYIKLNELAAQVMGFSIAPSGDARTRVEWPKSDKITFKIGWNPCEDLNDASALLNKVCGMWRIDMNEDYAVEAIDKDGEAFMVVQNNAALAMTLAALRASGIPESSITEATGG